MTREEINKKLCFAKMVIGAIDNLKCPMLMYDEEKDIVKKALLKYISELENVEQESGEEVLCHTNLKENAELIAKILDADARGEVFIDKIKAEIEKEYNLLNATRADETLELGECLGLKMSLKIINKYTAEMEDKNEIFQTKR